MLFFHKSNRMPGPERNKAFRDLTHRGVVAGFGIVDHLNSGAAVPRPQPSRAPLPAQQYTYRRASSAIAAVSGFGAMQRKRSAESAAGAPPTAGRNPTLHHTDEAGRSDGATRGRSGRLETAARTWPLHQAVPNVTQPTEPLPQTAGSHPPPPSPLPPPLPPPLLSSSVVPASALAMRCQGDHAQPDHARASGLAGRYGKGKGAKQWSKDKQKRKSKKDVMCVS